MSGMMFDGSTLNALLKATAACFCLGQPPETVWRISPGLMQALSLGADWSEWSETQWQQILHPDDAVAFLPLLAGLLRGEAFTEHHVRLRTKQGGWLRFASSGQNEAFGPFLLLRDITTQVQVESALHDSQIRLNSLYDSAPISIILWTKEGRISGWNEMAAQTFGHTRERVLGEKLVPLLIHPDDYSEFSSAISRSVRQSGCEEVVCRSLNHTGEVLKCRWRNAPLRSRKGALIGIFSLAQDVTAEMLASDNLRQAKESAERLSQAKSEFMAVVGHELRTPLNHVLGMAQLLQTYDLDEEMGPLVQTINDSGGNLLKIINAIMSYADADRLNGGGAGQLFSLPELLLFGTQVCEFQAQNKGLAFELSLASDLPELCEGDEEAIKKIMINLAENAVRFTDAGSVKLSARVLSSSESAATIEISVADTGIGMSADFMSDLYQPFHQAASAITRKHGGVGLGLALVRKLVDRLGGQLSVTSELGLGTCFVLQFSLKTLTAESLGN